MVAATREQAMNDIVLSGNSCRMQFGSRLARYRRLAPDLRRLANAPENNFIARETNMIRYSTYWAITATFVAALACAGASDALAAKKKMSYEDAYGKCKAEIGSTAPGNESLSTAARSSAAGACMKKYGFRLKK
jgi:hypothetical protein